MKKEEENYENKLKEQEALKKKISDSKEFAEALERELGFEEECQQKLLSEKAELTKQRISEEISLKSLQKTVLEGSSSKLYNKSFALYDVVVHIDSFQHIFWQLEVNENPSEEALNFLEQPPNQIVIGIMGREKVGKSYIMGRLSGLDLPVGYHIQTQGLSMKYSRKDNILTCCLDSAGVHAPVYYFDPLIYEKFLVSRNSAMSQKSMMGLKNTNNNSLSTNNNSNNSNITSFYEEGKENFGNLSYTMRENLKMQMINDRKLTETFIEDFILYVSKVILVVVGQLSQDDQAIIERIRREYKEKKYIIIVHNFMLLSTMSSIKAQIEKDIYMSCEIEERTIPGCDVVYYCEKLEPNSKSKYQIAHFIYCQENTDVGNMYNPACLRHIWDKIKTIDEREKFNVVDSLQRFFRLSYKNYIKITAGNELKNDHFLEAFSSDSQSQLHSDPLVELLYDPDTQYISLKLKDENLCVAAQNPTFTALGSLIVNNLSEFEPKYELIEYLDNEFVCAFEICNLEIQTLKVTISREINNENLLVLRGNKIQANINNKKNNKWGGQLGVINNNGGMKYGLFEKMISIGPLKDEYLIKEENGKQKIIYKDGVLLVFFSKKIRKVKGFKF